MATAHHFGNELIITKPFFPWDKLVCTSVQRALQTAHSTPKLQNLCLVRRVLNVVLSSLIHLVKKNIRGTDAEWLHTRCSAAIADLVGLNSGLGNGVPTNATLRKAIFQVLFQVATSLHYLQRLLKDYSVRQGNRKKYLVDLKTKADAEGNRAFLVSQLASVPWSWGD